MHHEEKFKINQILKTINLTCLKKYLDDKILDRLGLCGLIIKHETRVMELTWFNDFFSINFIFYINIK